MKDREKIWAILLADILEKNKFSSTHVQRKNVLSSMNSEEVKLLQGMKHILVSKKVLFISCLLLHMKSNLTLVTLFLGA